MSIRLWLGTLIGFGVGVAAIVIWMFTFEPHGGPELSHYLFPVSAIMLERMYEDKAIPVPLWYGGALFQWICVGVAIDYLRKVRRNRPHSR